MLRKTVHSIARCYTFLGIFSMKVRSNELEVFKTILIFNSVKILASFLFIVAVVNSSVIRNASMNFDVMGSRSLSITSKISSKILFCSISIASLLLGYLQVLDRERISKFFNLLANTEISPKYSDELRIRWRKHIVSVLVLFTVIATIQFLTFMKFTLIGLLGFILGCYSHLMITSFTSFLKTFEIIFLVLLEDLTNDLRATVKSISIDISAYEKLSRKHRLVYRLITDFNETFGYQLTIVCCNLIFMATFQVPRQIVAILIRL